LKLGKFFSRFEGRDDSGGNMNNRSRVIALAGAGKFAKLDLSTNSSQPRSSLLSRASGSLIALALAATLAWLLVYFQPQLASQMKELSAFSEVYDSEQNAQIKAFDDMLGLSVDGKRVNAIRNVSDSSARISASPSEEQARVATWLARRYHIANNASDMLVELAYTAAYEQKIDPLLVLAVMAIESRFNPLAESRVGAKGLMQVLPKANGDKFHAHGGLDAVLNPVANIQVGAKILKDFIRRGGSVEAGLKLYVGAGNMTSDLGYGNKVLQEYERLKAVAAGKSQPNFNNAPINGAINIEANLSIPVTTQVPEEDV
jgi:soluble lytic murein transglycosylase-like protein